MFKIFLGLATLALTTILTGGAFASTGPHHCPDSYAFTHAVKGAPWVFEGNHNDWPIFDQTNSQNSELTELPPEATGRVLLGAYNGTASIECDYANYIRGKGLVDFEVITNQATVTVKDIPNNFNIEIDPNDSSNFAAECYFHLGNPESCRWS